MLHIKNLDDGEEVFKALGSELRIMILKLLLEHREMNMKNARNVGGLTLFGTGFGNYNQDIKVRMAYRSAAEESGKD